MELAKISEVDIKILIAERWLSSEQVELVELSTGQAKVHSV